MLLCIDIGNTNIVFGVYKGDELVNSFILETNHFKTVDEYGLRFMEMIKYMGYEQKAIAGVIIASVVPQLDGVFTNMILKYIKVEPLFVNTGIKTGINVKLDSPKQLGADLLVGAVAAVNKYNAPIIVIDMGTAITFTYVNENKELLGGIIVPGIKTGYSSLIKKTSRLEEVNLEEPKSVVGKDTVSAIQSGMIFGTSSLIDGLIRQIKNEKGDCPVVITGGESRFVLNSIKEKVYYEANLMLEGLKYIYNKNKK
ncbi:MAG TPA: type III pantothenate kinase [Bacilli bacterium]|nr:type III pantothenate kinase [Bacilli bacterium]